MLDIGYLNEIRRMEIEEVLPLLPARGRILEFGSGTGEQARFLAEEGFDVVAIDLASSNYANERIYPVEDYDGHRIPLDDNSVDAIFSSNVLEHVENFDEICTEFHRVLRRGGIAVHVLPTPAWRFWSLVTGAADSIAAATALPRVLFRKPADGGRTQATVRQLRRAASGFMPKAHGTAANVLVELGEFSRRAWRRKFHDAGFEVIQDRPLGLFYSGTLLVGRNLSMIHRRQLSRWFGSATHLYVLKASPAHR